MITNDLTHLNDYLEFDYADYWKQGRHVDIIRSQESRILRAMMPANEGWFADLGSGAGRHVSDCLDERRKIVMVDFAPGAIRQGHDAYAEEELWGVAADVARLPFRDGVFSGAIAVRLIQNSSDIVPLVREIYRVLQPGAYAVISYFNRRSLLRLLRYGSRCLRVEHTFEHKARWGNMCATHPEYFRKVVEDTGFRIIGNQNGSGFSYQLSNNSGLLRGLIDRSDMFMHTVSWINKVVDRWLGRRKLSLWQFVLLQKPSVSSDNAALECKSVLDILCCTFCLGADLRIYKTGARCHNCGRIFLQNGNLFDFLGCGS